MSTCLQHLRKMVQIGHVCTKSFLHMYSTHPAHMWICVTYVQHAKIWVKYAGSVQASFCKGIDNKKLRHPLPLVTGSDISAG